VVCWKILAVRKLGWRLGGDVDRRWEVLLQHTSSHVQRSVLVDVAAGRRVEATPRVALEPYLGADHLPSRLTFTDDGVEAEYGPVERV
jgi:hypothetical protein